MSNSTLYMNIACCVQFTLCTKRAHGNNWKKSIITFRKEINYDYRLINKQSINQYSVLALLKMERVTAPIKLMTSNCIKHLQQVPSKLVPCMHFQPPPQSSLLNNILNLMTTDPVGHRTMLMIFYFVTSLA